MLDAPDRRSLLAAGLGAAVAAGLPTAAAAQTRQPGSTVVVTAPDPVISLQTWLDTYGRPAAAVRLNGQGPFRFLVDTGSTTTVVSSGLAARLGLPSEPARTVHSVTGNETAPFARVSQLQAGSAQVENLLVAVMDGPAFSNVQGVLGMDMFAGRRLRFSLQRREVDFLAPNASAALPIRVPIQLRNGLLVEARGRIGGVSARCVLDTGAQTSMLNPPLMAALARAARRTQREPAVILGVTRDVLEGQWVALPMVEALGLKVRRLVAVTAPAPIFPIWGLDREPAMLMGMDVLSGLDTIIVDYRRRQLHLRLLSLMSGNDARSLG